jgi:hypothetical protein
MQVLAEVPLVAGHPVVLVVVMRGSLVRRLGMRDGDGMQAYDGESDADRLFVVKMEPNIACATISLIA